ncbi:ATP-binding protein [Streptomyces parvus]|uniref:AAA family ATPase n=1 Tax=Streptomyces parvus TaxID=66428 RepID=UPI0012391CD7|nr:AAA family ATPase [Streptomyces parvus]KAA6199954.1 ATP-binding protein [Streptomyces parvus]GGS33257.1 ATP-binding protein [Streptomyces parvus]
MIIWLNGTFGAGKTTTAKEVISLLPDSRLFDTETVGWMLRHVLGVPEKDFQDFPPWRGLVVETARQVLDHVGGTLVVTQTVLVEAYWQEIREGLAKAGVPVHHFLLHTDRDTLVERIETDTKPDSVAARQWRLDHLSDYERALLWLRREAQVVDTTGVPPTAVAETVLREVRAG